jgi:hypothetical protein
MSYMKLQKSFLVNRSAAVGLALGLFLFSASGLGAVDKKPAKEPPQLSSAVGIRLGAWTDISDARPNIDANATTDIANAGFATELFFDIRVVPRVFCEISMSAIGRGDIVINGSAGRIVETINLYPLVAQLKLSPLAVPNHTVLPFILAGGGVAVGRQNPEFAINSVTYDELWKADRTEAVIIGVIGGGCDFIVADQIGINVVAKYIPIKFGSELAGLKDFSGMSFGVGISYFLHK